MEGLLLPNDATHRGEGYVTYTIQPKAGLPTGTQIPNAANIVFDYEKPITTNTVMNTIDSGAPTSAVKPLPEASLSRVKVSWAGEDDGSGVGSYDVWVSEDDKPYELWLQGTTETSAVYQGRIDRTYRFYSVARDNVGNVEGAPTAPDATTRTTVLLGDLNGDKILNVRDAVRMLRYIVGLGPLSDEQIAIGDMNADGILNIKDVVMALRASVGLPPT